MPASLAESRDQILGLLKAAVDAAALNPQMVLIFDDVDPASMPEPPAPWARVKIKHSAGGQVGIGGIGGTSRYRRLGVLVVQLFTPNGKGMLLNDQLVPMILNAYEGKTTTGGHVFRNGRFQEVGKDGPWQQTNVFVDFEVDEIK